MSLTFAYSAVQTRATIEPLLKPYSDQNVNKPFMYYEKKKKTRAEIRARYKTELCRQFTEQGFCPFGDVCYLILF